MRPIGPEITVEILGNHFQKYGEIRDIHIPVDFHTQQPRGFAYIEYVTNNYIKGSPRVNLLKTAIC